MGLFEDFVETSVFIHDDYTDGDDSGFDWDKHGTKPFLLNPRYCVVNSLQGFGEPYLEYLESLDCIPTDLIVIRDNGQTLLTSLFEDKATYERLRELIKAKRLNISGYYGNSLYHRLADECSSSEFVPTVSPGLKDFLSHNSKTSMRLLLEKLKVPIPLGTVCFSPDDIMNFCKDVKSSYKQVILKSGHWSTQLISSDVPVSRSMSENLSFPLVAEVYHPHIFSPISHNILWNSMFEHLYIVEQNIREFEHLGNSKNLVQYSFGVEDRIRDISSEICRNLSIVGVVGIDFIVLNDADIRVVDVNPRFNSSTYPYAFLRRNNVDLDNTYADYGFILANVMDLSSVFRDPEFEPFTRSSQEGMFLFSPAVDTVSNLVKTLSYISVSKTKTRLIDFNKRLKQLISKHAVVR